MNILEIQKNKIKELSKEIEVLHVAMQDAEMIMKGMIEEYGDVAKNKKIIEKIGNLELPVVIELLFIIIKRRIQNLWRKKK